MMMMKDQAKTKELLINELVEMRQRVVQLQAADTERKRAEEALRNSQEELQAIFDSVKDGIALIDTTGKVTKVNKRIIEIGGYTEEEIIGKRLRLLTMFPPQSFAKMLSNFAKLILDQEVPPFNVQVYTKTGERKDVELRGSLLRRNGKAGGMVGVMRDITERKQVMEELRESEQRLTLAIDGSNGGQWHYELDPDDSPHAIGDAYFSPRLKNFIGYEDNEFPNSLAAWESRIVPEDLEMMRESSRAHRAGKTDSYEIEYRIRHKDGSIRWIHSRGRVQRDERGRPIRFAGIDWDITERKQAVDALRESEERLKVLFEFAPDAYYMNDLKGSFIDGNKAAEELSGYDKSELIGKSFLKLKLLPLGQIPKAAALLARSALGKATGPDEFILNRKDGSQVPVEIRTFPVQIKRQTLVLGIARDITERKRAEEERQRLYKQAQRDAEIKTALLQEVNHRVQNNLTALIGLLYIEQEYARAENRAAHKAITQSLTIRIGGLATVHSLLTASEWAPLPLNYLAGQVIKSAMQIRPRDKTVFIDAPPSPVQVTADQAHHLALVINELATNTIKHTLPGRNEARISVRTALEDDGLASHAIGLASHTVVFEYRDDGPGYPEDVLRLERHAAGFDLINNLIRKSLRGELSLHNDGGAVAVIRIPAQA